MLIRSRQTAHEYEWLRPLELNKTNFCFIGYDHREDIAYRVCEHSLLRRSSRPLTVIDLNYKALRGAELFSREWTEDSEGQRMDVIDDKPFSTEFSHTRFLAPEIARVNDITKGWILFCDCDFLFLKDVDKLFKFVETTYPNHAAACVKFDWQPKESEKMDGQKQLAYEKKLWSSLMLINMGHKDTKKLTTEYVNTAKGLDLHQFKWTTDDQIGAIPSCWNYIPDITPMSESPSAIHYSLGGPWFGGKFENMQFAQDWHDERLLYQTTIPGNIGDWVRLMR